MWSIKEVLSFLSKMSLCLQKYLTLHRSLLAHQYCGVGDIEDTFSMCSTNKSEMELNTDPIGLPGVDHWSCKAVTLKV